MLALKDYGSSDDNSEPESEREDANNEVKCHFDNTFDNTSTTIEPLPSTDKLITTIDVRICSAPEVVPTVRAVTFWISHVSPRYVEYILVETGGDLREIISRDSHLSATRRRKDLPIDTSGT